MKTMKGDILANVTTGIIVHQCNAQGVMGAGIAKQIKEKWPQVYKDYKELLSVTGTGIVSLGSTTATDVGDNLTVVSLVAQDGYASRGERPHRYTSYDALDDGFEYIAGLAKVYRRPVHFPLIGAGLGGGEWSIIEAIIRHRLKGIEHTLWTL